MKHQSIMGALFTLAVPVRYTFVFNLMARGKRNSLTNEATVSVIAQHEAGVVLTMASFPNNFQSLIKTEIGKNTQEWGK